jgi:hypothetical protein
MEKTEEVRLDERGGDDGVDAGLSAGEACGVSGRGIFSCLHVEDARMVRFEIATSLSLFSSEVMDKLFDRREVG